MAEPNEKAEYCLRMGGNARVASRFFIAYFVS